MSDLISEVEKFLADGGDHFDQADEAVLAAVQKQYQEEERRAKEAAVRTYDCFMRRGKQGDSVCR